MERLIGTTEFAELAHSTPATVRYWVATGYAPPSAKLGRRRVWKLSVVAEWIDSKFAEAAAENSA